MNRRLTAIFLATLLLLGVPLNVLADGQGGGTGVNPTTVGNGTNPSVPYSVGVKVSVGPATPVIDSGIINPVNVSSTGDQIRQQSVAISDLNKNQMWDPGNYGLNFVKDVRAGSLIMLDSVNGTVRSGPVWEGLGRAIDDQDGLRNVLGWMIYPTNDHRPVDKVPQYDPELAAMLINKTEASGLAANPMDWLSKVRQRYESLVPAGEKTTDYFKIISTLTTIDGTAAQNWRQFTWSTIDTSGNSVWGGNVTDNIQWSQTGILTGAIYLAWAAQDKGDIKTYEEICSRLGAWASSEYDYHNAVTINLESLSGGFINGKPAYMNGPTCISYAYAGFPTAMMYQRGEPAEKNKDMLQKYASLTGNQSPAAGPSSVMRQFWGHMYKGGNAVASGYSGTGSSGAPRNYGQVVRPFADKAELYGWAVNYPLYSEVAFPIYDSSGITGKADPPGKFTWDLTPKGVHDVTPADHVNAGSLINNLNIAQNGYNNNNYAKWEAAVRSDDQATNKIKISIYRISETLAKDAKSTVYERSQVKAIGKDVKTGIDYITPGNGLVSGIPGLGTLESGKESRDLTDDEFLNILKTATGLSYTETVAGPLVINGEPKGTRITYGVYVDVKRGNKGWQPFDNNQAEYVEYRSVPGTYTFTSDDPDGYAEIKTGYFDADSYSEPFEAMAGTPTTEKLYFVSGGQEFVAQLKYEFVENKEAIRNFEQKYTTEPSASFFTSGVFYTAPASGLTSSEIAGAIDWNSKIEGVNSKTCPFCGIVHFAGSGGASKPYATTYSGSGPGGNSFSVPGPGLWDLYDVVETSWNWESPDVSDITETDSEGNTTVVASGGPGGSVQDSPTQPESLDYEAGSSVFSPTEAVRWTFKVRANLIDMKDGRTSVTGDKTATALTSSIKFQQAYQNMNYAKIKEAHIWRLERSRVEGIDQLTFTGENVVDATADELPDVIFNAAKTDTAADGRMYYSLHPQNADNFVFTQTLKTRGSEMCYNHLAAEDLIASAENPNNLKEQAWSISDYLVLLMTRQSSSLVYHEYETLNRDIPILNISVSGNRQDNGYTILNETSQPVFRTYEQRGQSFRTQNISYNTQANGLNGTREKVCENSETFYGGDIDSGDLGWGGYNGNYSDTSTTLAAGSDSPPGKYKGRQKHSSNFTKGDKKIFKTGYVHNNQGEVNGFSTSSPQALNKPSVPFVLVKNDIAVDKVKAHNGKYDFDNSSIFYHNIINFGDSPLWNTGEDQLYKEPGFHRDTSYSSSTDSINSVVIHNPVSTQLAKLIRLPAKLDQRVNADSVLSSLNKNKLQSVHYDLDCKYDGLRYYTWPDYAEVAAPGLSQLPVTGSSTTVQIPITVPQTVKGSHEYGYTGGRQSFTAPASGRYTFTLWGASGGASTKGGAPGLGGMTKADVYLNEGQTVYFYVGSQGGQPNGGYNGGGYGAKNGGGGGGMTSLSIDSSALAAIGGVNPPIWDHTKNWLLIAPGGGGSGPGAGGNGGGLTGDTGSKIFGTAGTGGTQSGPGTGGSRNGQSGSNGVGGSNTTSNVQSGAGGGGAGWFGGGAGGNDYPSYKDVDDSGAGGGSAFINQAARNGSEQYVVNSSTQNGVQSGNGKLRIEYNVVKQIVKYVESTTGTYTWDKSQGDVLPVTLKPQIYTAPTTGYYSVHLFGAAGGGDPQGQASAGGLGGYAGGQIYLTAGQKILVTVGGTGANATKSGDRSSGGYNGGGHAIDASGGGHGGGGATDIATSFTYADSRVILANTSSGVTSGDGVSLSASGAFYWGPRMTSQRDHIYRVDYYGENLTKATFDSLAYTQNWSSNTLDNATLVHSYVTDQHAQLFWKVNTASIATGQEFRVKGADGVLLREVFAVDMDDRLLVAPGGGGADNPGGILNGEDDGRGGNGGGLTGENGYTNGVQHYANKGAQATSGYGQGYGQSASGSDAGAGGGGWYGGFKGQDGNSGGGGGSANVSKLQYGVAKAGQNSSAGYALFVHPGKGNPPIKHVLSSKDPHKAPNSNWKYYVEDWIHEEADGSRTTGGNVFNKDTVLISPGGFRFTMDDLNNRAYIIQVDGQLYLTDGPDTWNDATNMSVVFDKYTTDMKTYKDCVWKATNYDAACYDTAGSINPENHYAYGDATCYTKKVDAEVDVNNPPPNGSDDRLSDFVVLDHDMEIEFPNRGDFYGNGSLGIKSTTATEGWGYIDGMDTTIWLREKYLMLPFDVTYNGKTFLAGEKVMLGRYDEDKQLWIDDQPSTYKYTFHVLLNNSEMAAAKIDFVAIAKNTPFTDTLENRQENRNYTRYGSRQRAYHDAWKPFYLDVIGRIGVMSILDTGDFRFSNFYKESTSGWRVNGIVHEVDLSKQNYVTTAQRTIFDDPISADTKGQDTWGTTPWAGNTPNLKPFPLTPGQNNIKALKNQAHRIGYPDFMSLVTVGNYYGENSSDEKDTYKTQIQPYYYYYNLKSKEWVPLDVYIKDKNKYKKINEYNSSNPTTEYEYLYNLDWEAEQARRMYVDKEETATKRVQDTILQTVAGQNPDADSFLLNNISIPTGIKWLHGTANMLFLTDRTRTFIGTRNRYGENTEKDNRIADVQFNRQAQRWHYTLGLPSSSVFVRKGDPCTPENIAKYDMEQGVIICALDTYARGKVWTLRYDETPVGERSFYLFDNKTTLVSWENAGNLGPQGKQVVTVYTDAQTSRNDLSTEGTH